MKSRFLARSTLFAAFFAVTGYLLASRGLLTTQYVTLIGAIHGFITVRAIAEDYKEKP